jgi:hypothetical protein
MGMENATAIFREHADYRRLFQHVFGLHLVRSNEHVRRLETLLEERPTTNTHCALEALRTRLGDPRLETAWFAI